MGDYMTVALKPFFPEPALLIQSEDYTVLTVADLHIGWESSLSDYGIYIPSQTKRLLKKLVELLTMLKPQMLILLGDVKHAIVRFEKTEWVDVPEFLKTVKNLVEKVVIVPGNHDGDLETLTPEGIEIVESGGLALWDEVGFFHGHSWPKPELFKCQTLVIGHVHPAVAFRDRFNSRFLKRVWVKAHIEPERLKQHLSKRIKTSDFELRFKRLIIMPSFNDFMRGRAINEDDFEEAAIGAISPILRTGCIDMENSEIYLLDGIYIGSFKDIREITRTPLL
ncbi:MAG: metallophosphoesterase [Candidatus Bathyarchaeia archaeon]